MDCDVVLTQWLPREREHQARADDLTRTCREWRSRGEAHPVLDFLFTYYPLRPAALRRWHPGAGVVLAGTEAAPRANWAWYRRVGRGVAVDTEAFLARRASTVKFIGDLLRQTMRREPQFGCFGLHEWAMVYRAKPEQIRHRQVPLRLSQAETDVVVERSRVRCTHYDAFRFFTDAAAPRNELQPTRATQLAMEQSGCLHANMDCYRWAIKLIPVAPAELTLDCFELARDIRELDMRASPYDLTSYGYAPVRVETPEGKAEYVAAQRAFSARADQLRVRMLQAIEAVTAR